MKKKEALIKIRGVQRTDGDDDVVELLTTGFFARKAGGYLISYDESSATCILTNYTVCKNCSICARAAPTAEASRR